MSLPHEPSAATPSPGAFATSTRILAGALISALPIIAVTLLFILGDTLGDPVPLIIVGAVVAGGLMAHLLALSIGYRVQPLERGLSANEAWPRTQERWTQSMVLRFALTEAIAIISITVAFVVSEGGYWIFLTGMTVSLVLLWVHVWPRQTTVNRVAESLEREGVSSGLRQAFGHA